MFFFFFSGQLFWTETLEPRRSNLTIFCWRLDLYIVGKTKNKVEKTSRKNKVETVFTSYLHVVLSFWLCHCRTQSFIVRIYHMYHDCCLSNKIQIELKTSHRKGFQEKEHQPKHMCLPGGFFCVSFFGEGMKQENQEWMSYFVVRLCFFK